MRCFFISLFLFCYCLAEAQIKPESINKDSIVQLGVALYRLEVSSWLGGDMMVANYKDPKNIGGYFSYFDEVGVAKCVFVSVKDDAKVIGVVSFYQSENPADQQKIDLQERRLTEQESAIWKMRKAAVEIASKDTFFIKYQNASYNYIPIIRNGERKVYILTASQLNGKVFFGNDYLLTFDEKNNLLTKQKFHNSLIPSDYGKMNDGSVITASVHTHLPHLGQVVSATDICTLLLYKKITNWKYHVVISKDLVSIWDMEQNALSIMTVEDFQRMNKK